MKFNFILLLFALLCTQNINAQSLAINTDGTTANASALLDVKSTAKGILIPRMSRTERNAIASPATGLLIFQSGPDSIGFHYYDGTKWTWIFSNSNVDSLAWRTGGNTGTNASTNFIGTKDNVPFNIRVNNQKAGRIDNGLANTSFGYQAGNANTSGQNNAAFGHQALLANLSGTNNTAIGGLAANGNTTGGQNTATGYASMILNTVGQNNTAYGFYSLYNNVAGSNATAIGNQSMLYANNTITPFNNNNVAVGSESLKGSSTPANNTGLNNTSLGYQTLFNNSAGSNNTASGYVALFNNTTGYANNAIGDSAGYNLTTGFNNVFLGHKAGYNVTTGSNKLYIANNSTDPPIIYGDFSNKTIGLGTITPNSTYGYAKLEIASEGYGSPSDILVRNAVNDPGYAPGLNFQHARGTLATPLAVVNGDYMAAIASMNYDGTSYVQSAGVDVWSDGAVSTGIVPTKLQFYTMNSSGSLSTRLTIKNDGKVGVGTIAPFSAFANNSTDIKGVDGYGLNTPSIDWAMSTDGYIAGLHNAFPSASASGLLVKIAGTTATNRILDLSVGAGQNVAGTPVMVVNGNGLVGIGTSNPISTLANTSSTIVGSDGVGVNQFSLSWVMNFSGYAAAVYNNQGGNGNGLAVKVNGTSSTSRVLDVSSNAAQGLAGNSILVANADGKVGIGTNVPKSSLQVDGTIAIGVTSNLAGGAVGSPVSLNSQKSYVDVLPADATNNYYQLPDPATCVGRMYIIRNSSSVNPANITTAAGSLFPGNSGTGTATFMLSPTSSPKTVMCISDGVNWTVIKQD